MFGFGLEGSPFPGALAHRDTDNRLMVRDYPRKPVPEETFTHSHLS